MLRGQLGGLHPPFQHMCLPARPASGGPEAAAGITFQMAGFAGYSISRAPRGTLTISQWSQSDGACENERGELDECPGTSRDVAVLHVPEGVRVEQAILELVRGGPPIPLKCEPVDDG